MKTTEGSTRRDEETKQDVERDRVRDEAKN